MGFPPNRHKEVERGMATGGNHIDVAKCKKGACGLGMHSAGIAGIDSRGITVHDPSMKWCPKVTSHAQNPSDSARPPDKACVMMVE